MIKAGIIGGGITGLTTAIALQKVGISSVVFEQAPVIKAIGAGIWLQPNAIRVLDWLGMLDKFKSAGVELNRMEITDSQLKPFKKIKNEVVQDEAGNKTLAIHRASLQEILYQEARKSVEIRLNWVYQSHRTREGKVVVQFGQAEEAFDLLLAADGINSAVRKNNFPASTLRSAGQICWRGVARLKLPEYMQAIGQEAWGKQVRFGFSQISTDEVYWFAVIREQAKNNNREPLQQQLMQIFQDFHPQVNQLLAATDPAKIHEAHLQDLVRLSAWHQDRVCLLGDAAHATTPNMGQGACQGIKDAYFISKILSEIPEIEVAFRQFEQQRRKKVDYIVNNSWRFGKMAHSHAGRSLLKLIMKMTPEKVLNVQMNKLYKLEE